jgi:predicted nucleic acid-binding protein
MDVLVDTSVWSLAFRKKAKSNDERQWINLLSNLIQEHRAQLIGPIRQEILSGISSKDIFFKLKEKLEAFEDLPLTTVNYERAAEMFNLCRKQGIQGSHIDFLICSAAEQYNLGIFTLDKDFEFFAKYLPIKIFLL